MDDGKKVWAPHPTDGFIQGQIVDITSNSITVETFTGSAGNKTIEANYDRVYPSEDDDTKDVDDNCALMYLNEATLLNNVRLRYKRDQIYTYVANILIAVNPYREIKNIYCVDTIRRYKGKSIGVMPPHVFAIADKAYRDMRMLKESQSIIVSGEVGAGKTESTKYVLRYLTQNWGSHAGPIEERILQANPLLEAFGNAKTVRNNNSSRFGKFVEIHFSSQGVVDGGYISHYLLEKSRICVQNREERNYHVFYQMCAGAPAQMKQQLRLGSPDQFHYLNRGCTLYVATDASDSRLGNTRKSREYLRQGCLRDPVLDDAADFGVTEDAMRQLGFRDDERRNIYAIVAGVLHLGNVSFEDDEHNSRGGSVVSNVGSNALSLTSAIFGLENDELRDALTARVMQSKGGVKGTVIKVPLKVYEAMNARDALAKAIYAKLFDSIVRKINDCIPLKSSANYIGVLDIAGFEYFPINSFEQFCINYCNEKLQQFFNERILKDEQQLYEYEGLGLRQVNYSDNQDCIDLIEAKAVGIFDLLDEESKLPRPDPANFTASVHQKYPNHFRLSVPRKSRLKEHRELRTEDGFLVRHFAGAVCYQTAQFIEKNNDALHASLAMLLAEANNAFLRALFTEGSAKAASSAGGGGGDGGVRKGKLTFISIGNKFRTQLGSLMEKLRSTGTSFIRCIKPNQNMVGHKFEGAQILSQLQCSGMASVLSLMQQGYPSRAQFSELYSMYRQYLPKKLANLPPRMFYKALFKARGLDEEDFRFGLTKVFFRPGKFAEFDKVMRSDPEHFTMLVKRVEHWLVRSHWKKAQYCAWAVLKLKNKISWRRQQLIVIQKHVKGYLARKKHQPRIRGIMKVRMIKAQLCDCEQIIGQLRHDRDASAAEVADLQRRIDDVMTRIKTTAMTREEIDRAYTSLIEAQDRQMAALKCRLGQQKIAEEQKRLRRIEEERERERRRKEDEEQRKRREEEEKRSRIEMEAKRKAEEEAKRAHEERNKKAAEALQAEFAQERLAEEARQQQQERRDHELAMRLAQESGGVVEALETPQLQRSERARTVINAAGGKTHELSKWKYAELRYTINTSRNVALLDACREEFHRRLRVYHEWKSKNKKAAATENQRAPQAVIENSQQQQKKKPKLQRLNRNIDMIRPNVNHRFFRLPFLAPADMNREPQAEKKGWWYAHFDGQWIARQLELYPDKQPVLLIAGTDDMQMCELSLEETGLTRKRGAEILARQFEDEWKKLHGGIYVRPSSKPR